jgi:hypothetical protein
LSPAYHIDKESSLDGHRGYEIICTLTHIQSGLVRGQGVGCCSTWESKYAYRWPNIDRVPQEYWDNKDESIFTELYGEGKYRTKKTDKGWFVQRRSDNEYLADEYNTVLKMAKKRSLVDAVLTCTSTSDIFTQDIDEKGQVQDGQSSQIEKPIQGEVVDEMVAEYGSSPFDSKQAVKPIPDKFKARLLKLFPDISPEQQNQVYESFEDEAIAEGLSVGDLAKKMGQKGTEDRLTVIYKQLTDEIPESK